MESPSGTPSSRADEADGETYDRPRHQRRPSLALGAGARESGGRRSILQVLNRDTWFRELQPPLQADLLGRMVRRDYAAGSLIYAAADSPTGVFALISGEVRLINHSRRGNYGFYSIFMPGQWFGALSELDGLPRFSNAIAAVDSCVLHLGHAGFHALLNENETARRAFIALLCRNFRKALDMIALQHSTSARCRIARILLSLHERLPARDDASGKPQLTHETLAIMVGISRQTVGKILQEFATAGLIQLGYGSVVPTSTEALGRVARGD